MLGGTQSLHTNSYDEALALPTEEAVRIALRTQQIIAHETGVANTIDPLGGAYFVEALTDELERQAYDYFAKIDELGGMVVGGQAELPPARDRRRRLRAAGGDRRRPAHRGRRQRVPPEPTNGPWSCTASIRPWRPSRSRACARCAPAATAPPSRPRSAALKRTAAREDANLMPGLLDAARAHATEGEIIEALQEVFGSYTETPVF